MAWSPILGTMLGEELRMARKAAGMTQDQLSVAARVDRTYISNLENDKCSPTLDALFRLCDAMGISAASVVGRIEMSRPKRPSQKPARRRGE